jgi:hypothetical protein
MAKPIWASAQRSERWCFTIPMDAVNSYKQLVALAEHKELLYLIVGEEEGEESGYKHYQGFAQFINRKTFKQIKDMLVPEAHIEVAKGTLAQNTQYCSKQGKIRWSVGIEDKQERKKKIQKENNEIWLRVLKDAQSLNQEEFIEKHPREWVLRRAAIERLMLDSAGNSARKWNGKLREKNLWIWGPTSTGKSRWANCQAPPGYLLKKNVNKWWCGYNPVKHRCVVIDDYPSINSGGNCLVHHMKLWADRYPFQGEVKGSTILVQPGRFCFIVTSNFQINECFSNPEDVAAIERRFKTVEMTKSNAALITATRVDMKILQGGTNYQEEEEENFDWFWDAFRHEEEVRNANEEAMTISEQEEAQNSQEEW